MMKYFFSSEVYFTIDKQTGVMRTLRTLDREVSSNMELTVLAVDDENPDLSASVTVIVNVVDVNDNSPVFNQRNLTINIPEEKLPGPIYKIQVSLQFSVYHISCCVCLVSSILMVTVLHMSWIYVRLKMNYVLISLTEDTC